MKKPVFVSMLITIIVISGCDGEVTTNGTTLTPGTKVSVEPAPSNVPAEEPTVTPSLILTLESEPAPSPNLEMTPTGIRTPEPTIENLQYEVTQYIEKGDYKLPMSKYLYARVHYACLNIINTNVKSGTFNIWFNDIPPLKELEGYPINENFHTIFMEPYQSTRVCCPSNDHPGSWTYQIEARFNN